MQIILIGTDVCALVIPCVLTGYPLGDHKTISHIHLLYSSKLNECVCLCLQIAFDCSWLPRPLLTSLSFQNPFKLSHRLHTAREM